MLKTKVCSNCHSNKIRHFLDVDDTYALYQCCVCFLVFTDPQPVKSSVTNFNDEKYDSREEKESRLADFDQEYKRAKKHIVELKQFQSSGKLLDVGCSYGIGVKAAGDLGFEALGIEPTKKAAAYATHHLSVNVLHTTLEKAKLAKNSFDVVTLYDVLEHVPDLHGFLKEIYRILKPGGLLVIQSPNINSFAAIILKTKWNWLLVPHHLWHFSYRSLSGVLQKSGFSVLWKTTEDNVFDFASNLKSSLRLPYLSAGVIFKVIRQVLYLCFYGCIGIGTNIWRHLGKGGTLRFYAIKN
jgi:SAM-dependent methyltransferase